MTSSAAQSVTSLSGSMRSPQPSTVVAELRGIHKSFPGVNALQNVSFDLKAGEVHALMGENGAGKSTLMKILTGVYQPDSGEIAIEGRPVHLPGPRDALELGISIIHQELNLMSHLTAAQNIFIGREPRKPIRLFVDEAKMNAYAQKLFDHMKIDIDPRAEVGDLTVARQQLIEIAKAVSYKSKILIMDEPTSALNDIEVKNLFAIIDELKAQGVGIVYITHKMDEVQRIADRITVMRDGRTIDTLPAVGTTMAQIISLMVGRDLDDAQRHESRASHSGIALEVKGLHRGKQIRDVSFTLKKGEILGFAGLMGAGRTEVARAIFGADPIESGEILINGQKASITSPRDAVEAGIAYLSEDRKRFGLVTGLSVSENVTMSSWQRFAKGKFWMRDKSMRHSTRGYVDLLKIKTPSVDQETRLLSGGNQQKVVIAKWLMRNCDILFFDEPTRGIDVGAKSEIYKLLHELAEQGKAIVVISSELPEVLRLSQRILVMCEGQITGELDGKTATQESIMTLATKRTASNSINATVSA